MNVEVKWNRAIELSAEQPSPLYGRLRKNPFVLRLIPLPVLCSCIEVFLGFHVRHSPRLQKIIFGVTYLLLPRGELPKFTSDQLGGVC